MAETYSVEAYLRATGVDQFTRAFNNADKSVGAMDKSAQKADSSIKNILKTIAGVAAAVGVFNTLRRSISGAISRYDTLNNFPRVLQQMGFSAKESEGAIKKLSDGIQGLPTTLDDVAGTAQRIAILTNDLGGAVNTTLALNNAFISSGSDAANASRGLEQYVQMLSKGEVDLQSWRTLQETMGVALNDVAKAFGYAGASAQNDLYEALKDGTHTFDEFNDKLIELSNETGGFADRALTASGGIRTAWTNMNTAVVRGVTNIIGAIDNALSKTRLKSIQNIIETIGRASFTTLDTIAKLVGPTISAIAYLFKVLEPLAPVVVGVTSAMAVFMALQWAVTTASVFSLAGALETLAIASMLAWDVIKMHPFIAIISAIAGLAAMFVYLWKTNEKFRDIVTSAWESVQKVISATVEVFRKATNGIANFFKKLSPKIVNGFNKSLDWMVATGKMIGGYFSSAAKYVGGFIGSLATGTVKSFSGAIEFLSKVGNNLIDFFKPITGHVIDFIGVLSTKTVNAFNDSIDWLSNSVKNIGGFFSELRNKLSIKEVIGKVVGPLTTMATMFLGLASPIGWVIKGFALLATQTSVFSDLMAVFSGKLSIGQFVNNFASEISKLITYMAESTAEMITKGAELITGFIQGIAENLPAIIEAGTKAITNFIEGLSITISDVLPIGVEMITKLVESIVGVIPLLVDIGVKVITTIIDAIVTALPIIINVGIQIINTLVKAITTFLPILIETGVMILTTVIDGIVKTIPLLIDIGIQIINTLIDTIATMLPMLMDVALQLVMTIIDTIITMLPVFIETFITIGQTLIDTIITMLPLIIDVVITLITTIIDTITTMLPILIESYITIFMTLIDTFIELLPLLIDVVITLVMTIIETLIENIPLIIDAGIQILMALIDGIITTIPALIDAAIMVITELLNVLIENLPMIIDAGVKILMALINGIIKVVPSLLSAGVDLLLSLVKTFISLLPQLISAGVKILLALIQGIISILPTLISVGIDLIIQLVAAIIGMLPKLLSAGKDLISSLIKGALSLAGNILSAGKELVTSLISGITGLFGNLLSTGKDLAKNALDGVLGMGSKFLDAGKNIVGSIADGIKGAVGKVKDAISNVTQKIRNFLPFSPAKEGALMDIMDIQLVQSIAQAIEKGEGIAVKAMAGVADSIYGEMPQVDIAGQMSDINSKSRRLMKSHIANEIVMPLRGSDSRVGDINQTVNIHSPTPLSPSDIARKQKQASRQMALEWS